MFTYLFFIKKLRRRQRALELTASVNETYKEELKKGLTLECMSPEYSETESEQDDEEESSQDENEVNSHHIQEKRRIVRRPLSWRSWAFNDHLASLDRKWSRRATVRSKAMAKERQEGGTLQCEPPDWLPSWMKRQTL